MERLLLEQNRLRDEKKLLEDSLALKDKALQLQEQIAAAQIKVGEARRRARQRKQLSGALNHIYVGSRQKYEPSSQRKDGAGKGRRSTVIEMIKLHLFSTAERADSADLTQGGLERSTRPQQSPKSKYNKIHARLPA